MSVELNDSIAPSIGKLYIEQIKSTEISIKTTNFYDKNGIEKYEIYLNDSDTPYDTVVLGEDNDGQLDTTLSNLTLPPVGNKYKVTVKAIDEGGNKSKAVSSTITVKDFEEPTKVNVATLKANKATDKSTTLTWEKPYDNVGVVSFEIKLYDENKELLKTYTSSKNTLTIKNLDVATHYFSVVAIDKAGNRSEEFKPEEFTEFTVTDATDPVAGKVILKQIDEDNLAITLNKFSDNVGITSYKVYVNDNEVNDLVPSVNDNGQLQFTYKQTAIAGKITVKVIAIDEAGNESKPVSSTITIKDVTDPDQVTDLGYNEENATQKSTTLTWEKPYDNVGVVSYKINLYDKDGNFVKTYTSKTESLTIKKLAAGWHKYSVIAIDKAKNESRESDKKDFEVADSTAPTVGKLILTQTKDTEQNTITITTEKFSDNVGITSYKVFVNGNEVYVDNYKINENKQLECTYFNQNHEIGDKVTVSVIAYDDKGLTSKEVKSTITLKDVTNPDQVTGLGYDKDNATQKSTTLTWALPPEGQKGDNVGVVSYEIYVDGKKYTSKTNELTIKKLAAGTHSFYVVALDKAGNRSEESAELEFDVADITAPTAGKIVLTQTEQNTITVTTNKFSDNVKITEYQIKINGNTIENPVYEINENGQLEFTYTPFDAFAIGDKVTVTVKASDAATNVSKEVKSTVTIKDITAPDEVEGLDCKDGADQKSTTLTWEKPKDNVGVVSYEIYVDGKKYTSKTESLTIKNLAAGEHSFYVVALDKAKKRSDKPTEQTSFIVKDITAPKAGKITLKQNGQNTITVTIDKFRDNKDITEYTINGVDIAVNDLTINTKGQLEYVFKQANSSNFAIGDKVTITVTASDEATNVSKEVKSSITIKDMEAPEFVKNLGIETGSNEYITTLTWDVANDNSNKIASYEIELFDKDGNFIKKYTSKTNELTIKNLAIGSYSYKVYAIDKSKNKCEFSDSYNFEIADVTSVTDSYNTNIMTVNRGYAVKAQDWNKFAKDFARKSAVYKQSTKTGNIKGTDNNDTLKFQEEKFTYVDGDISLGNGDDKIELVGKSGFDNYTELQIGGNIDLGDGNNTFQIENARFESGKFLNKNGDLFDESAKYSITFGSGNDTFNIINAHEVEWGNNISFGNGDDTLYIKDTNRVAVDEPETDTVIDFGAGKDSLVLEGKSCLEISNSDNNKAQLLFGDGDDILEIKEGANIIFLGYSNDNIDIDFGAGSDKLIINGGVLIGHSSNALKALAAAEDISGKGYIVATDNALRGCTAEEIAKFTNAGIKVYSSGTYHVHSDFDMNMYSNTDKDNAQEATSFYELGDGDIDVYLIGEAWNAEPTNDEVESLKSNTVDWFKFTVDKDYTENSIRKAGVLEFEYEDDCDGDSDVTINIYKGTDLNKAIKTITLSPEEEASYKVSSLAYGDYYLEVLLNDKDTDAYARISINYEF